jgi:hypothetical protein
VIRRTAIDEESVGRLSLKELLTLSNQGQRQACFAGLRQRQGGGSGRCGKLDDYISLPDHCDPVVG